MPRRCPAWHAPSSTLRCAPLVSHWAVSSDAAVKLMTRAFDDVVDARHQLAVERHRLQQQVVALAVVVLARSHEHAAAARIEVPGEVGWSASALRYASRTPDFCGVQAMSFALDQWFRGR